MMSVCLPCMHHLSIIKVTEASDNLLLVELIGFELHASNCLHCAVVLKPLLSCKCGLQWWALLQLVQVTFLPKQEYFQAFK